MYHSDFSLGDKVTIDQCVSIVATVTSVMFGFDGHQAKVSWFNNGALIDSWVDVNRLDKVL